MRTGKFDIGMVGLGVMGRNFVLNMADHGFSVVGFDKDEDKVKALQEEAEDRDVSGVKDIQEFVAALRPPRAAMMLVPAGAPVDSVISDLLPHMEAGDLIIDGGNSHFTDTNRRAKDLTDKGIHFLGVGISGGESGARHGPSMMPGGPERAYERVRPIFEAAAAKVNGDPCVTHLGPGSAGHYVKMVHNGIEYGIMQLISETYDLMKRGLGLKNEDIHAAFDSWNRAELNSYLVEITAKIFKVKDEKTGNDLIDMILDQAKQKGTGMWTSQDAMDLQAPVPNIDIAVAMRHMSAIKDERRAASRKLSEQRQKIKADPVQFLKHLRAALYAAMILTYAQGLAQLKVASHEYLYDLDLEAVARIWRGGCIIRSALLEEFRKSFKSQPDLANLLLDAHLGQAVMGRREDLQAVVSAAAESRIPAPGMMLALAYLEAFSSEWLPANLIQAQRDFFGSHTYERIDQDGIFHTQWENR
ncbi:MAG: NADP-dependent phosphogluconate dehydrogenase [Anaerolineales bacterium]|jgi:6-phosphogluconate dehydrogenase